MARATMQWQDAYRIEDGPLRVHGRPSISEQEERQYLSARVRERLRLHEQPSLAKHLIELAETGFSPDAMGQIGAFSETLAPWQIGEILAEVLMEDLEAALFPWPSTWDKKNVKASTAGTDLVGLIGVAGNERFVFAEVKTSGSGSARSVVGGAEGLCGQLERLLDSGDCQGTLISYLLVRSKGSPWWPKFRNALVAYFRYPRQTVVAGVLMCCQPPSQDDFGVVQRMINGRDGRCNTLLLGFYFATPVTDWYQAVSGSEGEP